MSESEVQCPVKWSAVCRLNLCEATGLNIAYTGCLRFVFFECGFKYIQFRSICVFLASYSRTWKLSCAVVLWGEMMG